MNILKLRVKLVPSYGNLFFLLPFCFYCVLLHIESSILKEATTYIQLEFARTFFKIQVIEILHRWIITCFTHRITFIPVSRVLQDLNNQAVLCWKEMKKKMNTLI